MRRGSDTVESGIDLVLIAVYTGACPHSTEIVAEAQDGLDLRYRAAVCFNKTCYMRVDAVPRKILNP